MTFVPDLASYDRVLVAFSGGKDSIGCFFTLLDQGVPRERIELWHHLVDGREGSRMMDWPCTEDYCRRFGEAFGVPVYFSWKVGGFEGEMDRDGVPTAPTKFEMPEERGQGRPIRVLTMQKGGAGPNGRRLLFPQVSADLSVRWCSAYLKIDVAATAIRNQQRFEWGRTLFVTGERAEESTARANYLEFEPHRSDSRGGKRKSRHVDHWRPVKHWPEKRVWETMEAHRVNPHPAYRLGWGRVSCMKCIFGNEDQWASARAVDPEGFGYVARKEQGTGKTIHRSLSVIQRADRGQVYEMDPVDVRAAMSETFDEPIVLGEGEWRLPRGAYGDSCGPT